MRGKSRRGPGMTKCFSILGLTALVWIVAFGIVRLAFAQGNAYQPQLLTYNGPPINTCDVYQIALDLTNGVFYFCKNRVWTPAAAANANINFTGADSFSQPITSSVSTGTAPFSIASTTQVTNLNAQLHGGLAAPASAIVGLTDTQTLTNKTIDCTLNTLGKNPCIVYSTASASTNANINATTMATAGGSGNTYRFGWYFTNTVLGTSCTGNSTVQVNLIWQDPSEAAPGTSPVENALVIGSGTFNGVLGPIPTHANYINSFNTAPIRAAAGTAVQYSVTFVAGANCAPAPKYQVFPVLEQLQ